MKRKAVPIIRYVLSAGMLLVLTLIANAQIGPVNYSVTFDRRPTSHLVHIALSIDSGGSPSIDVAMPAWSPGHYAILNAWRDVQEFAANNEQGMGLQFEKLDKQTWRVYTRAGRKITVRYKLYLAGYSERGCLLRGPSVFMYVVGKRPYPLDGPITVKLHAPSAWRIQTGMEATAEPNTFTAENYDTFVDASILLGPN